MDEVKKTQAEMTSQIAFSRDGTLNVARYLNEAIAVGLTLVVNYAYTSRRLEIVYISRG